MPEAAVISTGSGSGLAASIPGGTRTLVIGGAALAALAFVMLRGRGASAPADADPGDGDLSASANIALGQVAYEQRQAAGEDSMRDAELAGQLRGLESELSTQFGSLSGLLGGLQEQVSSVGGQVSAAHSGLSIQIRATSDPIFAEAYHRWLADPSAPEPWTVTGPPAEWSQPAEQSAEQAA